MDTQEYNEMLSNGDLALANDNLEKALECYEKALAQQPEDVYALSRAGAVCTALDKYDKACVYFEKAMEVDPENGDNVFNMGNAYFFRGDISKAVEMYSAAELKTCSEDVKARLYYQLAMCSTLKEDYKAALINYQKYQDADTTGLAMTDPNVITEKIKIYMMLEDTESAIKCAAQWVNVAPSELRSYMVYFNLLIAHGEFAKAAKVLADAGSYAECDEDGKFALEVSRAELYVEGAGSEADDGTFEQKAYDLLGELIVSPHGSNEQKNDLVIALAELCMKLGKIDEAINTANMLLTNGEPPVIKEEISNENIAASEEEIQAQMDRDVQVIDAKIAEGEIDESIGDTADVNYNEDGKPVRNYPDGVFGEEKAKVVSGGEGDDAPVPEEVGREYIEKAEFVLLSCYALKEDYNKVLETSRELKNSQNAYYSYFGHYSETFAFKKLSTNKEEAERKYEETIAFFRNEMMRKKENAPYAVIFRARMYAEIGKFAKAEEMASLMNDSDRASVTEYIAECRKEQGGAQ